MQVLLRPHRAVRPGRLRMLLAGVVAVLGVAGCSSSGEGQVGVPGLREPASRAYVSGDSSIEVLAPEQRGEPVVAVAGQTLDGDELDTADLAGSLVVLNVWGSWCAPCHAEAPELVAAEKELTAAATTGAPEVRFVGINIRDRSREAAIGFEEEYGIGWPSLYDPDSLLLLPLAEDIPPNVVPSTLVLDQDGRVAARLLGKVDADTLVGVVEQVAGAVP